MPNNEERPVETSFYYITSRYYDSEIGRFISPDLVDHLDSTTINGLNLYAYYGNIPIMLSCIGSTFCRMVDSKLCGSIDNFVLMTVESNDLNYSRYEEIDWYKGNSVVMTHHTTSLIENEFLGFLVGNFSYTITTQLNKSEKFYFYSNMGNDGCSVGRGINLGNWFGTSTYVSSNFGVGTSTQITPWFTCGAEISLKDGISFSVGGVSGNTTQEITANIGWGSIAGAYLVSAGIAAIPIPGARVLAGTAACIIFVIDIFN